jgi:glycolate oxidase FAD binding subunit
LGVLSEVSLKVQALPEAEATLLGEGLTAQDAVGAMSAALGSPYDVSGAAFVSDGGKAQVRLEGLETSVRYRLGQLAQSVCAGWQIVEGTESAKLWQNVRDVIPLAGEKGAIWRISVKPTDMPLVLQALGSPNAVCDWGGGLIWVAMPAAWDGDLRAELNRFGGHATLVRADAKVSGGTPKFPPEPAALAAISKGLRQKFDPRGILNPGVMG